MLVKVCGLNNHNNIKALTQLNLDFVGFIFYNKSPRQFSHENLTQDFILNLKVNKVAVFVNESINFIIQTCLYYDINYVQLHGDESPDYISELNQYFYVIKAFSISDEFDFEQCNAFDNADYFLFDTSGKARGGNGKKFNWDKLNEYKGAKSFLLSGGIQLADAAAIKKINHPKLLGVDINSGFEITPGIKNTKQVAQFIKEIK